MLAGLIGGVLPVGDGYVVAVANDRDGVVVRHQDGRWEHIGFPTPSSREAAGGAPNRPPLTAPGRRIAPEYIYTTLGVSIGLLLGGIAASRRWRRARWMLPIATVFFAYVLGQGSAVAALMGMNSVPGAVALIAFSLLVWIVLVRSTQALSLGRASALAGLEAIAVALGTRPFEAWSSGRTDSYEVAVRSATHLVIGSIVVMTLAGVAFNVHDRLRRSGADLGDHDGYVVAPPSG